MLSIIIAEDDRLLRLVLKKTLEKIVNLQVVKEVDNGIDLVESIDTYKPDVIFLDIDMPKMNGLDAAKIIFETNPKTFIIFATAYECYTHEAFEVYAFDYLIKPFKTERIHKTVNRIMQMKAERDAYAKQITNSFTYNNNQKISVLYNGNEHYFYMSDIIFITRSERKTVIHTTYGIHSTYQTLEKFEEKLSSEFFRCHKGYIINTNMVTEISPWGRKTFIVRFKNTNETALITIEKVKLLKDKIS